MSELDKYRTITGTRKHRIQISVGDELLERLDAACRELGITKSSAVAIALSDWLSKIGNPRSV